MFNIYHVYSINNRHSVFKQMDKWVEVLLPILIAEIIGLGGLIWKLASAYGELKRADYDNKKDLNNLGQKVRQIDSLTWQRVDEIEDFLEDLPPSPGKLPFRRKSLKIFEKE